MPSLKKILAYIVITATVLFSGCSSMTLSKSEKSAPKVVHAYLVGKYISSKEVSEKLKTAGFEVLGSYLVNKKNKLETVIFTCKTLQDMANKPNRGFAALGRVLVNV